MSPPPTVRLTLAVRVRLPDVPLTVTVKVPWLPEPLARKVSVLLDVAGFGLKVALTPLGKPEAESVTWPLKPLDGVILIVLVAVAPWSTNTLLGEADRLKLAAPAGLTVRVTVMLWVNAPEVPVMVAVTVPVAAVLVAVNVRVLVVVAGCGLKTALTPLGKPEAERVTEPLKPFDLVIVTVLLPLPPCVTVTLFGDADRLKSGVGAGFTVSVTLLEWVVLPLVPVMPMVKVPEGVVLPVVTVRVEEPEPATEAGLKLAVAPAGSPLALKLTVPLKPLTAPTVAV